MAYRSWRRCTPAAGAEGVTGFLCQPGDHACRATAYADRSELLVEDRTRLADTGVAVCRFASANLDAAVMFEREASALRSLVPCIEAPPSVQT